MPCGSRQGKVIAGRSAATIAGVLPAVLLAVAGGVRKPNSRRVLCHYEGMNNVEEFEGTVKVYSFIMKI